jgi:hypothetical protein
MNSSPSDDRPQPPAAGALRDAIVTRVIAELAPEELPLVEALRELDDETALERLTTRAGRSEPLGFGVEEAVVLLTPVIWSVVDQSVRKAVDAAVKRAGKSKLARRGLFRRHRDPLPPSVPALTTEQLATIEQCVLEATRQARLSQDRGERIADGVVRRLALMRPATEGPEPGAGGGA